MTTRIFLHIMILLVLLLPVSGFAAPVTSSIAPGLNVTGVTAALALGQQSAFPLLALWKLSGVTAIESYDSTSGTMLRVELDGSGNPSGTDFLLVENSALYVYSTQQNTLDLGTGASCAPLNLASGFNLAGHACFPPDYLASQFFSSVGLGNITSLSRLDTSSGRWQTAAVSGGTTIVGDDFPLVAGEGYVIQSAAVSGWFYPTITLTPSTMAVQQGQPGAELILTLSNAAPAGGTVVDVVSSDPALVTMAAQVTVLQGNTAVSIPLTVPDSGGVTVQPVTITASRTGLTSASASLSVLPKPTINLSPLNTMTGLTLTYPLTVNLSDAAPPGGFPVTLAAVPSGIVSVPASVTVPAGASSTQVMVTALSTLGSATISATSPGRGISGTPNSVTVNPAQPANYTPLISSQVGVQVGPVFTGPPPVQTVSYGPLTTSPLGVLVETTAAVMTLDASYGPTASLPMGVTVGSTITGITPISGAIGSSNLIVRALGVGLSAATAISFQPPDGITIQPASFAIGGDGNPEVTIDIAANAPVTPRTVLVALSTGGYAMPSDTWSNQFRVTLPPPETYSVQPLRAMVGQSVTMTIIGKYFASASSVNFIPATGITVNNPPTVSPDGTSITTTFIVAADAALGSRVVTVTTPGGTTDATPSTTNSFSVTAATDPGVTHTAFTNQLGVLVEIPVAVADQLVNYGPTASLPVGVTIGSTITGIAPVSGAIGSSGLVVRANGIGLDTATAISFYPPDGITVQPASLTFVGGNPEVTIDIAANAPVTPRAVLVALSTGDYAMPSDTGSNQFRVTLPQPEIYSLQPIRAMVGQVVAMTIIGKNFGSASSVNFIPATGITVSNPPTVNPDGTMITINITLAADAALGDRVVSVTTPGGVTGEVATTANTFSVTADAGITYTPLLSPEVGVMVSPTAVSGNVSVDYGPLSSSEVGVMVTPPVAPTNQDVDYGPLVSTQLGVAVGGVFTGFSPFALEPGGSASFTLTGAGLSTVTAITVVPATNLIVTAWTPAGDGLSGTVTITADSGAISGARTLVPMVGSTALAPSAAGFDILQVGYKPVTNSITTTFPTSTVQATVGSTVTLTINGVNLQGITKVEILPSDGITIDTVPTWFSDGTGEHVNVTVIVAAGATVSPRLVQLTTPYGSSSGTLGVTNTLSIISLVGSIAPVDDVDSRVAAKEAPVLLDSDSLTVFKIVDVYGLSGRKLDAVLLALQQQIGTKSLTHSFSGILQELEIASAEWVDASRGPPGV